MANLTKLSEYVSEIRSTIHDDAVSHYMISSDSLYYSFIRKAASEFSKKWPRRNSAAFSAVSQQYDYLLTTYLTNWVNGFSWIKSLEYPAGEQSAILYKADRFCIYNNTHLRFLDGTPSDTSIIRVVYYSPHVINASSASVPERFEYSVALYAAALALESLSAKYAKSEGVNPDIEVVSYNSKSDNYRRLAKSYKEAAIAEWGDGDTEAMGQPAVWNWYDSAYGDYSEYREQ